ncbi:hypothetical protein [Lysinibacillus xylanilyticus]|uniref:hypothetical protein n=1 Tax=Lysinibacillus xylanilyticus TaxID=582475 RepID=UPI00083C9263|nr:hypothetical protein [Lysinibacillus xylanilyticus]
MKIVFVFCAYLILKIEEVKRWKEESERRIEPFEVKDRVVKETDRIGGVTERRVRATDRILGVMERRVRATDSHRSDGRKGQSDG